MGDCVVRRVDSGRAVEVMRADPEITVAAAVLRDLDPDVGVALVLHLPGGIEYELSGYDPTLDTWQGKRRA